jgi:arabinofuranosyltransferase
MDAGLYSLIVTASFALLARLLLRGIAPSPLRSLSIAALIALTVLVRPEGLLWAPLQFTAFAWITFRLTRARRRVLLLPLASLILTPAALIFFRLAYFGYPLPNTYYAKVTASLLRTIGDGKRYFGFFTSLYGAVIYIPLLIAIVWLAYTLVKRRPRTLRFSFILLASVFTFTAFLMPILEGGEHFASFRMYQSVWPLLFISLVLPAIIFANRAGFQLQVGYVVVLTLLIGLTSHCTWHSFARNNRANLTPADDRMALELGFRLTRQGRENGRRLHELLQNELPTTGVAAAGGFAYGYNGTVYDLLGLNDVRMAHADRIKDGPKDHQSFNRNVFFQLAPDALMPWTMPDGSAPNLLGRTLYFTDPNNWDNVILKNIFNDPLFKTTYTPALVTSDAHPGIVCFAYFKNTYLQRLEADRALHLTFLPGGAPQV